jgi:hypothetical protein
MITIDPLDDDLIPGGKRTLGERVKTPQKGKSSPQAYKRGGLLDLLKRLLRRNTKEKES